MSNRKKGNQNRSFYHHLPSLRRVVDQLDYILGGRTAHAKPPSRDDRGEAIKVFERALALDPQSVEAQSWHIGLGSQHARQNQ